MECHAMVTWLPKEPPSPLAFAAQLDIHATSGSFQPTASKERRPAAPVLPSSPTPQQPSEPPKPGAASTASPAVPTPSTELSPDGTPPFPFLTLLVSGGHNMLVLTTGLGNHTILGSTLDDSIGEAFDKTARLLGLTRVPGGPQLEALARDGDAHRHALPVPLSKTRDEASRSRLGRPSGLAALPSGSQALRASCDFSFSGLKSAVRQLVDSRLSTEKRATLSEEEVHMELAHIAASFQRVAVEHLAARASRAIEWARQLEPSLTCLVVAGGVAANLFVRAELARIAAAAQLPMVCPPVRLCTDNGVMVAWTAMLRLRLGLGERPPSVHADCETVGLCVEVRPRWPLGARDPRSTTQQQQLSKRKQAASQEGGRADERAQRAGKKARAQRLVADNSASFS